MNYARGLIFDESFEHLLLKGDGEALGGKQEKEERRARDTMARECLEECGLDIPADKWTMFVEYLKPDKGDGMRVVFFFATVPNLGEARMTERPIQLCEIASGLPPSVMPDLHVLVPLAINWHRLHLDMVIMMDETARQRRKNVR